MALAKYKRTKNSNINVPELFTFCLHFNHKSPIACVRWSFDSCLFAYFIVFRWGGLISHLAFWTFVQTRVGVVQDGHCLCNYLCIWQGGVLRSKVVHLKVSGLALCRWFVDSGSFLWSECFFYSTCCHLGFCLCWKSHFVNSICCGFFLLLCKAWYGMTCEPALT